LVDRLRAFLRARGYLEVETPILGLHATPDRHLDSVPVAGGFLHTSPEFAMKRLLAAGSGPVFQIVKAFRAGESGRRHAVEFTIAEWYRLGPLEGLLVEMDLLLGDLLGTPPAERRTYRELFLAAVGADPLSASDDRLQTLAAAHGHPGRPDDRAGALDFLFSRLVEPGLGAKAPTIVTRFPAPLAALARLSDDDPRTAERFEVFWAGLELANGYDELQDPTEHRRRFAAENRARERAGKPAVATDERLLDALGNRGLPRCAGVALGVDRLVMAALGALRLDEVVSFREDPGS
jgi:lysyl-tRNA synthetase class 2